MTESRPSRVALVLLASLTCSLVGGSLTRADEESISFKKRAGEEKRFVQAVGTAIVKAAHGTAKKIELIKYNYSEPKKGRTDLTIKMEYAGAVSNKRYVADIVVKIDSSVRESWEVLNIDYTDNNTAIKHNERKLQELIRQMNK